ncbi:MAG: hypothetical protein AAFN74_23645 [Myxococcota bacterium]
MVCLLQRRWHEMTVQRRLPALFLAGASAIAGLSVGAAGCGDVENRASFLSALELRFFILQAGQETPCREATAFDRIQVDVRRADINVSLPGFPTTVNCAVGTVTVPSIAPGAYVAVFEALGPLADDSEAVIYSARREILLPSSPVRVVLEPEVGFLSLAWAFGDDDLAPCASEIGSIEVAVSPFGATVPIYAERTNCLATPLRIPRPLLLQAYAISVDAFSSQDNLRLFRHAARRFLVRGDNSYVAVLEPLGGRVNLDWRFALGPDLFTDCDAAVIQVPDVDIALLGRDGGNDVDRVTASCTDAPFAFIANRYTQGRLLSAILVAEGMHRFEGQRDFEMPDGDFESGPITLHAVGTATVSTVVRTASCAEDLVTGYRVTTSGPVDLTTQLDRWGPQVPEVSLGGLRYGTYAFRVVQETGVGIQCVAQGQRHVGARANDWAPLTF